MTDHNKRSLLQQARMASSQRFRGRVVFGPTVARPWTLVRYCDRSSPDANEAAAHAQHQATVWYPEGTLAGALLSADSVRT